MLGSAASMAQAIRKKGKLKKMSHGGWVESEPLQPKEEGQGFTKENIDYQDDMYDVEPKMFNKGGMCYAKGGKVSMMSLLGDKFLKKMSYGGLISDVDSEDEPLEYPEHTEENEQIMDRMAGTTKAALTEAKGKPNDDEDRLKFVRQFRLRRRF